MIFVGLLGMFGCLLRAYGPQNVPILVHLSLVKSSMSQKSNSSEFMHICVGNRSLIRELFAQQASKFVHLCF